MKPITVYRRATEAGLHIDLNVSKEGLVVFGPKSVKDRHMPLIKRHCSELWSLLIEADNDAAFAIAMAKRRRTNQTRRKATR
ncbi:MAG: hypothetical protein C0453_01765 [Comamonadaceae bacterium]|nr:hypothetical protein [Comamonadaceae bacterium]